MLTVSWFNDSCEKKPSHLQKSRCKCGSMKQLLNDFHFNINQKTNSTYLNNGD